MPITPLYEWSETEGGLEVRVQLQGASRSKADVFATDCMLKVNSPPHLLIIDLFGCVDESKSVVSLLPDSVVFRLKKQGAGGIWGQLEPVGVEKEEVLARRNASIDRAHARLAAARKERLERKQREEKEAVDRQIELDRKKRQEIEARKKKELEDERAKLVNWQQGMAGPSGEAQVDSSGHQGLLDGGADAESDYEEDDDREGEATEASKEPMPDHPDYHGRGWQRPADASSKQAEGPSTSKVLLSSDDEDDEGRKGGTRGKHATQESDSDGEVPVGQSSGGSTFRPLPPPRIRLQPVQVEFTKLETNHLPAREHREEEIRVYKKSLRDKGLLEDSTDVADRQPVFLKDKGDALYRQGNFRGAINAYTRALDLEPDQATPAMWSNRAACHLQLGEHQACANDCSRALEILQARLPKLELSGNSSDVETVRRQLVKALARRAQSRVALGRLGEAEADYVEALRYDSDNQALRSDLEEVRAAMQPADALTLKLRGNARFQSKDYEGAAQAFTMLLAMPPASVPVSERLAAYGNRAACHLVLERYEETVQDCSAALDLHLAVFRPQEEAQSGDAVGTRPHSISAPADSAAGPLHRWLIGLQQWPFEAGQASAASKVAARRGSAFAHLRRFADSAMDYESAAALAHLAGDEARQAQLNADVARVRALAAADASVSAVAPP